MKKIFFIFGLSLLQSCLASDKETSFLSSDEYMLMETEDTNKGEDDNINNFVRPVYLLQGNNRPPAKV